MSEPEPTRQELEEMGAKETPRLKLLRRGAYAFCFSVVLCPDIRRDPVLLRKVAAKVPALRILSAKL